MATEQEWTCLRKRRYASRKKARDVARQAQARAGRMRAYRCPFGSPAHWHVGHDWRDAEVLYERGVGSAPPGGRTEDPNGN